MSADIHDQAIVRPTRKGTGRQNPVQPPLVKRDWTSSAWAIIAPRVYHCRACGARVQLIDSDPLPSDWTATRDGPRYLYTCGKCAGKGK